MSSLPAEYGGAVDSRGIDVDIELNRTDVVSRVRAKFAQVSKNDMSR